MCIDKKCQREFIAGSRVFIRKYCSKEKWMPGIVLKKIGSSLYEVRAGEKVYRRHIDQILSNYTKNKIVEKSIGDYLEYDFIETEDVVSQALE